MTRIIEADLLAGDKISVGLESLSSITSGVERYSSKEGATADLAGTQPLLVVEGALAAAKSAVGRADADERVDHSFAVQTYPNPTSGTAHLELTLPSPAPVRVEVYDVLGRRLLRYSYDLPSGVSNVSLDFSELAAGLYLIYVDSGDRRDVQTIVAYE